MSLIITHVWFGGTAAALPGGAPGGGPRDETVVDIV